MHYSRARSNTTASSSSSGSSSVSVESIREPPITKDSFLESPYPSNTNIPLPINLSTQVQLGIWAHLFNQNSNHDPRFEYPKCNKCGNKTELQLTHDGKRPFYRCVALHKDNFSCFADLVGCDGENPVCLCGQPSRVNENRVGVVYYTCVTGGCDLFRYKR